MRTRYYFFFQSFTVRLHQYPTPLLEKSSKSFKNIDKKPCSTCPIKNTRKSLITIIITEVTFFFRSESESVSYLLLSCVWAVQQQQHHNFEQLEVVSPGLIRAPAASIEKLPFSWASFVPLLRAILLLLSLWFLGFTHWWDGKNFS